MGDGGPKLWENDALTLISCFRPVMDQKSEKSEFFSKNGGFDPSLLSALGWVYGTARFTSGPMSAEAQADVGSYTGR